MEPSVARKRATYEGILVLRPEATGQIVDGELYVCPRPEGDPAVAVLTAG